MNWPAYREYKDSDTGWLGDIPSHWVSARLKNIIQSIDSGTSVNGAESPAGPDDLGVLKTSCVSAGWFNADANKTVVEDDISRVTCPVQKDTLIVNRANTPLLVGSAGYVSHGLRNIYLSDKLWQVRFDGALAAFVYYWAQTPVYRSQIAASCVGASSSMQNLSMVDFRNVALALPPDNEQSSIVDFLSAQNAKIDALIGKQEQLIATLREDRTATITHAVTKGLDPHLKLVDSGVAWLGGMPGHWVPARLKNVILSIDSGTSVNGSDSPAGPDEIGVLKTSCVSAGRFNADANKAVLEEDLSRVTCPVQGEALIVNRANTPLLVGSAGYVSHAPQGLYLSDKLWQVRFGGDFAAFVYYWTQTQVYRSQIAASCVGASSSMQNLSMGDFRNVAITLPPEVERRSIVSFLSARTATIDALIAKSNEVIERMREYRSALITDAVTGKIDVRQAVA